jgi:hypothetical protein
VGGLFTCRKLVKAEPVLQICSFLTYFVGTETIHRINMVKARENRIFARKKCVQV